MRSARLIPWFPLLALLAVGLVLSPAAAEEKAGGHKDAHETKYEATIHHKDGKKETKVFDVSKPEEHKQLSKHLEMGEAEEILQKRSTSLFDLSAELGLWTLVVFLLLFLILRKVAWGPMLEGLKKREENIAAAIEESRQARAEAQHLRDFLQQERAKIGEEARRVMDETRRHGQTLVEDMQNKGRAEIQAERERLRREIATARDQALHQLWTQTAQLAALISTKAVRRELSLDDHRRLVDEALAELRQSGQEWQQEVASVQQA